MIYYNMLYILELILKQKKILLAMKKRGFGSGKWNGYGGKVKENESSATPDDSVTQGSIDG